METNRVDVVKLMIDASKGNVAGTKFSQEEVCEGLRKNLLEMMGTDKIDYKIMRKNSAVIFELLEEALDRIIPDLVEQQFDVFAETKSYAFGDKPVFTSDDVALFNVSVISEGNNNLLRQRLFTGSDSLTFKTQWKGISVYEDLYRFLCGRADWPATIRKVAESYAEHIRLDVYNTFVGTYSTINAPYKHAGVVTVDNLVELISHVEAATKRSAVIVGTKAALGKVPITYTASQSAMDTYNQIGYFGKFQGTDMVELKQGYKINSTDWALDDKKLLILPTGGVKPVKILLEGDSLMKETEDAMANADMSMEYVWMKKAGVAVLQSIKYGIFDIA